MILKKPYAFLIKYFRVIHLALTLLLIVGASRTLSVVKFFDAYVKAGYSTSVVTGLSKMYTPMSVYLIILLILVLIISMLILMIHKSKPYRLYLFMVLYYLLLFLGLFYISSVLRSFEVSLLAATTSRSIRDILIIVYIPQYLFIILTAIRTIGFDIKKFNFSSDLKEMEFTGKDAEEFEVSLDFEGYKAKRKVHRFFREMLYYVKENQLIFIIILGIVIVILGILIHSNTHGNYDKSYSLGKTFTYNQLQITFEDAIVSNLDYNGNVINDNYYYVVVRTHLVNDSGSTIKMDYNNLKLEIGSNLIKPVVSDAKYFVDYAPSLVPSSIAPKANTYFGLVYRISKSQANKSMTIKIHNGNVLDKGKYIDKHIFVKINPKSYDNLQIVGNYMPKDKISLNNTFLGNTNITINNYSISKSYLYKINTCDDNEDCTEYTDIISAQIKNNRQSNVILVLNVEYNQDNSTLYNYSYTSLTSFTENFLKIQYKIGDTIYTDKSINVTPLKVNNFMAFEVPNNIEEASLIQAIIIIRNREYIVNLKI